MEIIDFEDAVRGAELEGVDILEMKGDQMKRFLELSEIARREVEDKPAHRRIPPMRAVLVEDAHAVVIGRANDQHIRRFSSLLRDRQPIDIASVRGKDLDARLRGGRYGAR